MAQRAADLPDAVVLCVSPTGLAVARALAPRGVRVYGVDHQRREIGHASRWFSRDPRIAFRAPGPALLDGLLAVAAEAARPPVLFCANDAYLEFTAEHHEALRGAFVLADAMRPEVASLLLNKSRFYRRCRSLGVALPATFFPESESDARRAARELRYPAIVKPNYSHLVRRRLAGRKLVEVSGPDELLDWWRRLHDWGAGCVLQEVIAGPESNLFVAGAYVDAQLRVRSLFTARKSRQYPPWYGSGCYLEACWSDAVASLSSELLRGLEVRGIAGTEYKWDPRDQTWKLIELNPRPTLWFSLPRAAGVDVVWDAYRDLIGSPNPVHVNCQDDDVRWQLLVRDLASGWYFLRRGDLSVRDFVRTVLDPRRKDYAILSRRDPGTAMSYPLNSLWKYWQTRRAQAP